MLSCASSTPAGRDSFSIALTVFPDLINDGAAPVLVSSSSPVYMSIVAKSTVEYDSSPADMTMAEFISFRALSLLKPASKSFSSKSTTSVLSA